jgi:thiamine biosynthesis protein ThiI
MENLTLVRYGETWLKSPPVRRHFERILVGNIKAALPEAKFSVSPGRIVVKSDKPAKGLEMVFGVESFSPFVACEKDIEEIKKHAIKLAAKWKEGAFAVRARRTDKSFPLTSRDIENQVGKVIDFPCDLTKPDNTLYVEIRDKAYIYDKVLRGPGGLPLGSGGRAAAYLRDAEDLAAAWLVARRGVVPIPLKPKKALLKVLQDWCVGRKLKAAKSVAEAKKWKAIALVDGKAMKNSEKGFLVLNPLVGFSDDEKKSLLKKIKS